MISTRLMPLLVWLAISLVWGTAWGVIRFGLSVLPPFTFAAARVVLASVVLLLLAVLTAPHRRPRGAELRFWLMMGIPQIAFPYALIFWGEQTLSSSVTGVLFGLFPAITAIAAHIMIPDEPLTRSTLAAALVAAVAAVMLVGAPTGLGFAHWRPALGIFVAVVSTSLGAVLVRRHGRTTSTVWLTALQVLSAAVVLTALAILYERDTPMRVTAEAVASVLYLGLAVTVGCFLGLFWILKRLPVSFVSLGVILESAIAVGVGVLFLEEALAWSLIVGLVLVTLSIVLAIPKSGEWRWLGQASD